MFKGKLTSLDLEGKVCILLFWKVGYFSTDSKYELNLLMGLSPRGNLIENGKR